MKIRTYGNQVDVKFDKNNPEHACVSVRFPGKENKNWIFFVGRNGELNFFNEKTEENLWMGSIPIHWPLNAV